MKAIDVMSRDVCLASPDQPIKEAAQMMSEPCRWERMTDWSA